MRLRPVPTSPRSSTPAESRFQVACISGMRGGEGETQPVRAVVGKGIAHTEHGIGRKAAVVGAEHVHGGRDRVVVGHPLLAVGERPEVAAQADLCDAQPFLARAAEAALVVGVLYFQVGGVERNFDLTEDLKAIADGVADLDAQAGVGVAHRVIGIEFAAVIGPHRLDLGADGAVSINVERLLGGGSGRGAGREHHEGRGQTLLFGHDALPIDSKCARSALETGPRRAWKTQAVPDGAGRSMQAAPRVNPVSSQRSTLTRSP